jgi:hypothetical protein
MSHLQHSTISYQEATMNADTQAPFTGTKDTDPKEPKPLPMLQVLQKLRNGRLDEEGGLHARNPRQLDAFPDD